MGRACTLFPLCVVAVVDVVVGVQSLNDSSSIHFAMGPFFSIFATLCNRALNVIMFFPAISSLKCSTMSTVEDSPPWFCRKARMLSIRRTLSSISVVDAVPARFFIDDRSELARPLLLPKTLGLSGRPAEPDRPVQVGIPSAL